MNENDSKKIAVEELSDEQIAKVTGGNQTRGTLHCYKVGERLWGRQCECCTSTHRFVCYIATGHQDSEWFPELQRWKDVYVTHFRCEMCGNKIVTYDRFQDRGWKDEDERLM